MLHFSHLSYLQNIDGGVLDRGNNPHRRRVDRLPHNDRHFGSVIEIRQITKSIFDFNVEDVGSWIFQQAATNPDSPRSFPNIEVPCNTTSTYEILIATKFIYCKTLIIHVTLFL